MVRVLLRRPALGAVMIPPADIPALAARFQRYGALAQAEQLYRQALQNQPVEAELWAALGRVCQTLGRPGEAVTSLRRALELRPDDGVLSNDLGVALLAQGRLDEALDCLRAATRLEPDYPEAHYNQGIIRMRQGDPDGAALCFRRVLVLQPDDPVAYCNLGDAFAALGEHQQTVDCYRRAVQLTPELYHAWLNLGHALRGLGRPDEAVACYERAALLRPDDPGPLAELATLLMHRGELAAAVARFEHALRLSPDCVGAYSNMGLALMGLGRLEEARLSFEQALYLQPNLAEAHNNLGLAFLNQGRVAEARLRFERALQLRPDLVDAQNNLGLAWDAQGEPDQALASFERAVRIDPNHFGALTNLANACKDQGRAAESIAFYRKALASRPDDAGVHSNLLLAMQYLPGADPQEMLAEARCYARQHAQASAGATERNPIALAVGRRLRIGYVSADFCEHPVVSFLEPILAAHDRHRFEIFCYADVPRPDVTTRRLQGYSDHWRSLVGLSDAQAAERIRQDDIDFLVDLAGHTGGNRLQAFARRSAPIQVSYLGYLGTTGLTAMDYYITDAHADPPNLSEAYYQEQLIRLPECGFCYAPGPAPEVNADPPARRCGQITFGCLNNPAKVSDEVLALWSRVLAAVPGSRLLIRAGAGRSAEERARNLLANHGLAPERLDFAGRTASRFAYLELYHAVDIALDPFPYNGVTTTCDALWMGVPVISLSGWMSVSRQGVRFLRSIGLDELLAETPENYVRIAAELAGDQARRADLRAGLRERMRCSPLMDAHRLTRDLEAAYAGIWEHRLALCASINE
jgi:predicted O-linked N-acetylglucosamine transferase (SPINDLY family)